MNSTDFHSSAGKSSNERSACTSPALQNRCIDWHPFAQSDADLQTVISQWDALPTESGIAIAKSISTSEVHKYVL
jgi:hypothetical protein